MVKQPRINGEERDSKKKKKVYTKLFCLKCLPPIWNKQRDDKSDINEFITIYSAPRHITSILLTTEMYKQTELFTFMYSILALPLRIRASSSKQKERR